MDFSHFRGALWQDRETDYYWIFLLKWIWQNTEPSELSWRANSWGTNRHFQKLSFQPLCFLSPSAFIHGPSLPPDSGVFQQRATNSTPLYFSNMGSSQPLYSAEWSARYTWEISPSALCHLLPLTEPYVSELRLIHLSAALISIAAAKEVFHSRKAHWGVECLRSGWDWTLAAVGFCAPGDHPKSWGGTRIR